MARAYVQLLSSDYGCVIVAVVYVITAFIGTYIICALAHKLGKKP